MIDTGQKKDRVISVWTELTSHGEAQEWERGPVFDLCFAVYSPILHERKFYSSGPYM